LFLNDIWTILEKNCNRKLRKNFDMQRSAVIETFKTFSRQDIKEFGLFLQSPFFNTNQSVIKLFGQIRKLYPQFDEKQTDKKVLFEKAFGKIKYDDSFLRMTVFRLLESSKEFLTIKNLQRNTLLKETLLLDELSSRELNNLLKKSINELDKKIDKLNIKTADTYLAKYRLEYFKNELKARDTKMITYKDTLDEDLMLEQKSLNTYFFISSMKFFQYFLNQKNFVVKAEGYPDFMNSILDFLNHRSDYLKDPVLRVYYNLVQMLSSKEDKYFFELRNIIFENKDDIDYNEKYNLITILRNYAQLKYSEGNGEFKKYMIDILDFSIKHNILTPVHNGKYINEMRIMNIVWAGIQLKEPERVEEFLKKFSHRIEPEKKQYVLAYGEACVEFEKGNFSNALIKLSGTGPIKNAFYKAAIKQLTLMIYYEQKLFVPAAEASDAFARFIRTDKLLPEMYISRTGTFINFYNRLLKLNDSPVKNKYEISGLISELSFTSFTWLIDKANEFDNSLKKDSGQRRL